MLDFHLAHYVTSGLFIEVPNYHLFNCFYLDASVNLGHSDNQLIERLVIKSYALQSLLGLIQFNSNCCCEISPLPPCLWDPLDTGKYSVKNISSRVRYKYHQVMSSSQYPLTLSHLQLIRTNQHGKNNFLKNLEALPGSYQLLLVETFDCW